MSSQLMSTRTQMLRQAQMEMRLMSTTGVDIEKLMQMRTLLREPY